MSTRAAKELANLVWPKETVHGIENLAEDVGDLFFGNTKVNQTTGEVEDYNVGGFWDRFPQKLTLML